MQITFQVFASFFVTEVKSNSVGRTSSSITVQIIELLFQHGALNTLASLFLLMNKEQLMLMPSAI